MTDDDWLPDEGVVAFVQERTVKRTNLTSGPGRLALPPEPARWRAIAWYSAAGFVAFAFGAMFGALL